VGAADQQCQNEPHRFCEQRRPRNHQRCDQWHRRCYGPDQAVWSLNARFSGTIDRTVRDDAASNPPSSGVELEPPASCTDPRTAINSTTSSSILTLQSSTISLLSVTVSVEPWSEASSTSTQAVLRCYSISDVPQHGVVTREQVVDIAVRVHVISPRLTQLTVFNRPLQL